MRKRKGKGESALHPTNRRRYFGGDDIHNTLPDLTAIQLHESLLRNIEPGPGSINSSNID